MINFQEKLNSLDENSVWIFTKQETDFEESFKATLLFSEIKNKENTNIETYFTLNHSKYGIQTDRHRILVIPQLFGLLTKTPFYTRGGTYNNENCTAVFDALKEFPINSKEYNTLKTEQLLKLKIHAIIDTANNNQDYNILPIVFIYKVLKGLQQKHSINEVSIGHLFTYIMTCKSYDEVDSAIEYIRTDSPVSDYVKTYKDRSRILAYLRKNVKLFNIDQNSISINKDFDDYFYKNFILKYDFEELHEQLNRDVDYSYFLYNVQGFNINLIDEPDSDESTSIISPVSISSFIEDEDESNYINKVDNIKETNINEDAGKDAYSVKPVTKENFSVRRRYRTNPLLGKIAIKKAYYSCERDYTHETFISKKTNKNYMEAHHLVPVCFQEEMWNKYGINIDCVENLVSLCPTCHKAIHYGTKEVKEKLIEDLFTKCAPKYQAIGFTISLKEIKVLYGIK